MFIHEIPAELEVEIEVQTTFCTNRYTMPILNKRFDRYERHALTLDLGTDENQIIVDRVPQIDGAGIVTLYVNILGNLYAWQNVNVITRTLNGIPYTILYTDAESYLGNRRQKERYRVNCRAIINWNEETCPVTIYDVSETGVAFLVEDWKMYDRLALNEVVFLEVRDDAVNVTLRVGFQKNRRCELLVRKFTIDGCFVVAGTFI